MKIAIEGCAHGELEKIYDSIQYIEKQQNIKVDLLVCCGDFQTTRNYNDLECMAIPRKFFDICTFYKYYSGEKKAPILTIFIGGNHEASNYLQELPYGGWVAPNIYYLGYAGVININGIKIGGISGIYKGGDFLKGRHEFAPYSESTKRSVYHIRQLDVFRMKQLSKPIDIFISHDWPRGIYNFGNAGQLIRFKPFFKDEINSNTLGSPPMEELLHHIQPDYWFSAHLHCKFAALVEHSTDKVTKFLALDKCLPKRQFLQIIDIGEPIEEGINLAIEYDVEWLTVLNLTNHLISVKNSPHYMPGPGYEERYQFTPTEEEKNVILKKFNNDLRIPLNFVRTAEPHTSSKETISYQPKSIINPQTTRLFELLRLDDPLSLAMIIAGEELNESNYTESDLDTSISSLATETSFLNSTNSDETITPIKKAPLASSLPKPKWIIDTSPVATSKFNNLNFGESVIENFDNKWIEDRTPSKIFDLSKEDINSTITESVSDSMIDTNSILLNTTEVPVKKFKRRNESIYNTFDD